MKLDYKKVLFVAGGLLAAWQATNFSLNYRAVIGAVIASGLAGTNPSTKA